MSRRVRPAAVAGQFYPGGAGALRAEVDALLAAARPAAAAAPPLALVCPHAGYVYSGPHAAAAYALLTPAVAATIGRVIVVGPAHRVGFAGLAVPEADAYATPLGEIAIDPVLRATALANPDVTAADGPHVAEHSLEVQLPFLQRVLGPFTLLPVLVGHTDAARVAALIDALWPAPGTLLVVSSDLSHYHDDATARSLDARTCAAILAAEATLDHQQACGATPLNGLLQVVRRRGLTLQPLSYGTSGDTPRIGDRRRVVGYASFAIDAAS